VMTRTRTGMLDMTSKKNLSARRDNWHLLPSALNCSPIWNASSRVGVSARPNTPYLPEKKISRVHGCSSRSESATAGTYGSEDSCCSIGRANAAVLPLPVGAQANTSRPANAGGMHAT
jgi:hypothetical protein